ncbi:MAG: hypothetical protein KA271_06510 [Propionivibrio sp.]|jgi:hypothetical protein|nr:hypothetical protein [Propionivibrio sp.]MCX7175408.1 hypothetical protein [Pseudomonadota bacterium]
MISQTISKKQLLNVIDELQQKPGDRVRLLGDLGITTLGGTLGVAAAGTVAALAGATAIPAVTTAASWIGITVVAATPVGWLIGGAAAGGAIAYGVSRLIHNGGLSEGRRAELLVHYQERLQAIRRKETRTENGEQVSVGDKNQFIGALREIVAKNAIPPVRALDLIQNVENGRISLSDAYRAVTGILREADH